MVVLPKISALTIMVPLLSVFSVFAGMFAGLLVTSAAFGVSESQYIQATVDSVPPRHFAIGLVKALVYGFLVAYSGAWRGMRCGNSADAVGQAATSAVVMSLTLIVVADGIFAIILNAINL
jgi:phospholipid/cholesterol/gamma-HCH transport system permease protein